ncbi:hypothetical protein FISHEDRAFT_75549 [Fistulina hepatica ATCC 64428]|uniref:DUF6534 domain-containing protein n=1 Tax=Fistulina hepatica ATCC 64428 TaxID=1128425 RepID=A0A0D7A999_9AGAR|nr:hypothetical protein FISHEDRAFT_75549 [Fistulina hepatica ATCC 64428]
MSSLSSHELHSTFGTVFIGYMIAIIMYGFTFFQTYQYFWRFSKDNPINRATVVSLALLDTVSSALNNLKDLVRLKKPRSVRLYYYLVTTFFTDEPMTNATHSLCAEILVSALAIFIVQAYYSKRIWHVTENLIFCGITTSLSVVAFVLAMIMTYILFNDSRFEHLADPGPKAIVAAAQGLTLAAMLSILIVLCLPQSQSNRSREQRWKWIDVAMDYTFSRGALSTVIQLCCLVTFATHPAHVTWLPFHILASKIFINSLLYMLYAREVKTVARSVSQPGSLVFSSAHTPRTTHNIRFDGPKPSLQSTTEGTVLDISARGKEDETLVEVDESAF